MTPKEKAKELVDRFSTVGLQQRNEGLACAEIAAEEMINMTAPYITLLSEHIYWIEVKKEIEKL